MIVLGESENSLFLFKVPKDNITVFAALAGGEQCAIVGDSETCDLIIVCC